MPQLNDRQVAPLIPIALGLAEPDDASSGGVTRQRAASELIQHRIAASASEVMTAWRLVHDCYADQGLIERNDFRIHTTLEAVSPGTAVISGNVLGEVVSTLTVTRDGPRGLALESAYPREIAELRSHGLRLSEVGLFAHRTTQPAVLRLMSIGLDYGLRGTHSAILIGVHPRHSGYYTRMFGFARVGSERTYSRVNGRKVVLMKLVRSAFEADATLPRGVAYARKNPVHASFYAGAFSFLPNRLSGTLLVRYLEAFQGFAGKAESRRNPVPL